MGVVEGSLPKLRLHRFHGDTQPLDLVLCVVAVGLSLLEGVLMLVLVFQV